MQRTIITLALVSASALARKGRNELDQHIEIKDDFELVAQDGMELDKFVQWTAKKGKSYKDDQEFNKRLSNWKKNNKVIMDNNKEAAKSGKKNPVMLNHNLHSDNTLDELTKRLGFKVQEEERKKKVKEAKKDQGRKLASLDAATKDWTWATLPIEYQGSCGSCWAFAGNTVLESTLYIQDSYTNANAQKEALSHQYAVDCIPYGEQTYYSLGCEGGDAGRMWDYYLANGTVTQSQYPYTSGATGQTGQSCQIQPSDVTASGIQSTQTCAGESQMASAIQEGPLVGSFQVNPQIFSFYSFGLITPEDSSCFAGLGHQMVIVGLDLEGQGGEHLIRKSVVYARWKSPEDRENGCAEGEFEWPQYPDYCLWNHYYYQPQVMADGAFWKVQNSWGEDWGHEGFAYFSMTGDDDEVGTCGMYQYGADYVITDNM